MKVWTLLLRGGQPFSLAPQLGPSLDHNGTMTLWKFVGSLEEVQKIEVFIQSQGSSVQLFTEEQTEEQLEIRRALLGLEE